MRHLVVRLGRDVVLAVDGRFSVATIDRELVPTLDRQIAPSVVLPRMATRDGQLVRFSYRYFRLATNVCVSAFVIVTPRVPVTDTVWFDWVEML